MKAAFHTLGCKVNQYETEALKEQFKEAGYEIVPDDCFADVYVVNTCTVTNLADRKSRQFIRRARKVNPEALVCVTGCYSQMKPEEVSAIEGVQIVTGNNNKGELLKLIGQWQESHESACRIKDYDELTGFEDLGIIEAMEARSRAFIKIQEGCNRFCSYCIIPYARGKIRSRSQEDILAEVRGLLHKGYREIVLTGINTALYGTEQNGEGIEPLIAKIDALPGDFRIRLSSLEPTVIDAEYVKKLLKYDKLCHHLHLSIQSGSDQVLSRMNRRYDRKDYLEIVDVLRGTDPWYGISTDIIVGFPGETEEEFLDSLDIVSKAGYCKVHAFKYSRRSGTVADAMPDQIPGDVKNERSQRLIACAAEAERKFFESCVGTCRKVLFEVCDQEGWVAGYTDNYIRVYVPGDEKMCGEFANVRLTGLFRDGMCGEIEAPQERSK